MKVLLSIVLLLAFGACAYSETTPEKNVPFVAGNGLLCRNTLSD
jgi:hypothetical protein